MNNIFTFQVDSIQPNYCTAGGKREKKTEEYIMEDLQGYFDYLCGEYDKKQTKDKYYEGADIFVKFTKGIINKNTIEQFKEYAVNKYKPNSRRIYYYSINKYLKFIGYDYKFRLPPMADSNEYALKESEMYELLDASQIDKELNLMVVLLFDGILRPDELIHMKISNRVDDILYLNDTKTGNNNIVLSDMIQRAWDEYIVVRPQSQQEYNDYLFIQKVSKWKGMPYLTTLPIRKKIRQLGKDAGIKHNVKPYTIKRTSITLRLDKFSSIFAGDPKLVQNLSRHKNLETTLKYDRKTIEDKRQYFRSLNGIPDESNSKLAGKGEESNSITDYKNDKHILLFYKKHY